MKTIHLPFPGIRAVPLLFLIVLLTLAPAAVRAEWAIESVDTIHHVGKYSSIAVDGDNRVHISYFFDGEGDLRYAKKDLNSPWVTATIDKRADTGLYTSIGVRNQIHISYYNASNTKLRYANNAEGVWQTQDIDVAHDVGAHTALAVGAGESIHISYHDSYNNALKYATNAGGAWQVVTVDDTGIASGKSSIAVDSAGRVHISYYDASGSSLKYALKDAAGWHLSTLDDSSDAGLASALAIDSANGVHIAYVDAGQGTLKYATRTENGLWQLSTIDDSGRVGDHLAIALDEANKVHVGYYDNVNGDLEYATNMSGAWITETVDSTDNVGQFTSIAVGPDRNIHISYYDATNEDLKYAVRKNPIASALPSSITFDSTEVGATSAPQTLTVTNMGTGTLTIGQIGFSSAEFSLTADGCSNRTLSPLGACTLAVAFAPQTAGAKTAAATIPSNDPENPVLSVPLSSIATALYTITASAGPGGAIVPSGSISVNKGATQNFTITPEEGFFIADLLVDGVSVGALDRYPFIDIGADHTIHVEFASPVQVVGTDPVSYPSFQAAYSAIDESGIIRYQAVTLTGDLILNRPVSVYLQGGYNFDFSTADSFTTINGTVVIEDGTLTVENLEIR